MFYVNCLYYSEGNYLFILDHSHECYLRLFHSQMNFVDRIINLFFLLCFIYLHYLSNLVHGCLPENNDPKIRFNKLNFVDLLVYLLYLLQNLSRSYLMLQLLVLNYHDLLQDFEKLLLSQAYELDCDLSNMTLLRYFRLQFPQ